MLPACMIEMADAKIKKIFLVWAISLFPTIFKKLHKETFILQIKCSFFNLSAPELFFNFSTPCI
jgi:hypothetical protein